MTEPPGQAVPGAPARAQPALPGPDGKLRCPWGLSAPEYLAYHDEEWGRPVHGDRVIFERLSLEAFQSGLSWLTILRKRGNFRKAFADFDPATVAAFGPDDVQRLLSDQGIVRNRAKINAVITNARAALTLPAGLSDLVWSFADVSAAPPAPRTLADIPAQTPASKRLSAELRKHGFTFTGPVTAYATMQACGLVNDHLADCFARNEPSLQGSASGHAGAARHAKIPGMEHEEPDIAELFAPIDPSKALGVVLSEAHDVLSQVQAPVDAELWGSDMIGALSAAESESDVMAELATSLVPAAEEEGSPEALALLRIFAAIGSPDLSSAAGPAAERVAASGVPDPEWAAVVGSPGIGKCWHYSDVGGRQESVTMTFGYGESEHALSVLIDHGNGGQIKDVWVGDATGLLDKTWLAAESDPLVVFESIEARDARDRLERAVTAGESPDKPDQADDITAHRALLHARMRFLATQDMAASLRGQGQGGASRG
jgi:DNA-3-methyladenine glycosylase I